MVRMELENINLTLWPLNHFQKSTSLATTIPWLKQSSRMMLEVDAGAYSKALSGARNNWTIREEKSTAQTGA